ncbi:MAG: LysR family transcriptional regulator [Saccharospirillum sp.]|nr:LysR family transcriptional regulator [Saccharospirillum sp.]
MDFQQLKTFLEVCRTRHFGHAAQQLYLTQSAVSFRIRQLEGQLGTPLFIRHRNNLQLTVAGEKLRDHAEHILTLWQQARQDVSSQSDQASALSLASSTNVWQAWLTQRFVSLMGQWPGIHWRTETLPNEQMIRRLLDHTLDLAVLTDPPKVDELHYQPLFELNLSLLAPKGTDPHAEQPYALVDWGNRFLLQHSSYFRQAPQPVLHSADLVLVQTFIQQHQGCALLPDTWLADADSAWQKQDNDIRITQPLYLAFHSNHPDIGTLQPVMDGLRHSSRSAHSAANTEG